MKKRIIAAVFAAAALCRPCIAETLDSYYYGESAESSESEEVIVYSTHDDVPSTGVEPMAAVAVTAIAAGAVMLFFSKKK